MGLKIGFDRFAFVAYSTIHRQVVRTAEFVGLRKWPRKGFVGLRKRFRKGKVVVDENSSCITERYADVGASDR